MAGDYLTRENGVETLKEAAATSAGPADAGRLVRLNEFGELDPSLGGGGPGGGLIAYKQITASMLVGSICVWQHDLDSDRLDVTTSDSQGAISIPWKPLGRQHVELNFVGLTPITEIYNVLIEAY